MNKVYAIFLWFALLFCHNGLLAQNGGVIVTGKVYAEDRDRTRQEWPYLFFGFD